MKRICIFSFYNKQGYVADYVIHILEEFKTVCESVIIVINGIIDDDSYKKIKLITNNIVVRANHGFDAGAYKDIICNIKINLSSYDELILSNDTYYGPFISMQDLCDKMEKRNSDIWGLGFEYNGFSNHIPSMFLAFRKKVLKQEWLYTYFKDNINENTDCISEIYGSFEYGLFDFLVNECGCSYSCYSDLNSERIYEGCSLLIRNMNFLILKTKAACPQYFDRNKIINSLSYIKQNYDYSYELILNNIQEKYGEFIDIAEVNKISKQKKWLDESPSKKIFSLKYGLNALINYINIYDEYYIYGVGAVSSHVYWKVARGDSRFRGFIISNDQINKSDTFFGWPIYRWSQIKDHKTYGIVIAMTRCNQATLSIDRDDVFWC